MLIGAGMGLGAFAQAGGTQASHPHPNAVPAQAPGEQEAGTAGPSVPASNPRVQKLGHELMCMCGCNQILIECDHQGTDRCMMHDREMAELEKRVGGRESDSLILQSFVQEYGPQVLVVPPAKGFDLTAWLMPIIVSLVGLTLAIVVVQRWRERSAAPAQAAAAGAKKVKVKPEHLARARAEIEKEDF